MHLGREIASGGEGKIMEIVGDKTKVAKIFHDPSKHIHLKKAQPFLSKLPNEYFVKPVDLIDHNGQMIGFTMEYLKLADWTPISALQYDKYCSAHNISDKSLLLKKVVLGLAAAHNLDIVVGDLNGENVMTDSKEIRYIDVSPYATPVTPHNNIMQPEIVDWLYNAKVCKESDYFSLAVTIFQILTSMHPYKGLHPGYTSGDHLQKLKQRMIDKVSILSGDQKLVIPKSYKRINSDWLEDQFVQIFQKGDRFLLSIDKPIQIATIQLTAISTDKIKITKFFTGQVDYFFSYNDKILINSNIFEFPGRGWAKELPEKGYFVADNIISNDNGELKFEKTILDFKIRGFKTKQIGNIIWCLSGDELFLVDINQIYKNHINVIKSQVFGMSFKFGNGIVQNFSKSTALQINTGNKVVTLTSSLRILDFIQCGKFASVKFSEGQNIKFGYIDLENDRNKIIKETDDYRTIAVKGDMIFEPEDGKINILRSQDFQKISEIECNICTTQSSLFFNIGGIIIINNDGGYILNMN